MKNRILIVFIIILFLSSHSRIFASELCSPSGYSVITINGMFTNDKKASENRDNLKKKLPPTYKNEPLTVDFLYNSTHLAGVADLVDAVAQGLFDQKSDYDLVEMLNDASQRITTQKVLLVGHSQGNFYANNFYDKVASQPGGVPEESIGVYSVATPANRVAGGGKYLTSDTDNVIASTVARFVNILSPNIHISLQNGDGNGHSFSDVYLKYQGNKIVSDIKSSLNKLKTNDEQLPQDPCISPPEITALHKIQNVAFTSADFVINNTNKAGVYIADGAYNTGATIGSFIHNVGLAINNTVSGLLANAIDSLPDASSITTIPSDMSESENKNSPQEQTSTTDEKISETTTETNPSNIPTDVPNEENKQENTTITPQPDVLNPVSHGGSTSEEGNDNTNEEENLPVIDTTPPIIDTTPPVITILGNNYEVVTINSVYTDAGATAFDDIDGTRIVDKTGNVDTTTTGTYIITYTAIDISGNTSTKTRTVVVDDGAKLNRPNFVTVSGNYAYVVSDISNSLEIIDISNPTTPVHKGSIVYNPSGDIVAALSSPKAVAVSGNYAYVVSYGNTLEIIDVSNPTLPVHKSTLYNGDGGARLLRPTSIVISNNHAYIATNGYNNVEIVDISNPNSPVHKSVYNLNLLSMPTYAFVSDNYMYLTYKIIGQTGGGLKIIDISNPALPVLKNEIFDGTDGATISYPTSVFVSGNYAYITSWDTKSLEIVDISNPDNPIHKGKITSGFGGANFTPNYVFVSGNYAYITSYVGETLEIVDISDPTNPIHKGSLANGIGGAALSYPTSVFVSENYAYVSSSMSNALEIVDISDPTNPIHKGKISNGEFNHTDPVLSTEKQITVFDFNSLVPEIIGVVDEDARTISLSVPFGSDVTNLTPTILISSNASISPNSDLVQDFTNPVTYTVTAEDGSTQNYIVTVIIAPDSNPPSESDTVPPAISALSISPSPIFGYAKIGDIITLSIIADSTGYTAQDISVNNVAIANFTDNGDGTYIATYTVSSGDSDITSGTIPASVVLSDTSGNLNVAYTMVTANNLKIDANAPTLVSAEVSSANTISVTFSEDIDGNTVNTTGNEFTVSGHTVSSAEELIEGVITLTLSTTIGTGETPNVTFQSTNFKDLAGNQAINPITVTSTNNP